MYSFVFNTNHRFIVDDVPFGLCVLLGLGELVGCPMPDTAQLTLHLQAYLHKEYVVVDAATLMLRGRDVGETGAPQAYGVDTLEKLRKLAENRTDVYQQAYEQALSIDARDEYALGALAKLPAEDTDMD